MRISILSLLLAIALPATAAVEHSIGVARSDKTSEIHYVEHHQYFEDGRHRVDYYTPSLETLVIKNMSYPALPQHPRIEQVDLTTGRQILVEPVDGAFRMVVTENGNSEEIFVGRGPDVICDAGFDTYIKSEWERLIDEGKSDLEFAIAGREGKIDMTIEIVDAADGRTGFRVQPKNFLVKLFLPALELHYRDSDRKLMKYVGPSNLNAKSGDRAVTIAFEHHTTDSPLDQPLVSWLPETLRQHHLAAR